MGEIILTKVCQFIRDFNIADSTIEYIEVNISAIQIAQKGFVEQVKNIMEKYDVKPQQINMEITEKLILQAIDAGVNYFDTAYIYPGSEVAVGEVLAKNGLRDKVHLATKLPHYLIRTREGLDKLFNEQLRRLH